jgi:hypothetical protein
MEEVITHLGIIITVTNEHTMAETWSTFFSNAPGCFEPLHHVGHLSGFKDKEAAIEAGKKFVDEHQWQYISEDDTDIFSIYVRLWWNGEWGYSIRDGGMENKSGFKSREDAVSAAKKRVAEKVEELEHELNRQR